MVEEEIVKNGLSVTQIAVKYDVSRDTIERRLKQVSPTTKSKKMGVKKAASISDGQANKIARQDSLYARAVLSERTRKADWNTTKDQCIEDLRKVQKDHPDSFISRNFYRVHGNYSDSTWNQHFGTFHQFKRSAGLELSRSQHHLEKKIARHAHLDVYRKFFTEEVAPWVGKYEKRHSNGRIKTVLVGADFHDIEVDPFVLSVFIDTAKRVQPDVIVFNGDTYDEYEFSRFDQDPRQVNIKARYDFVRENIFLPIRKVCPNSQLDFVIGNHEQRILKLLADRSPSMKVLVDLMGITFSQLLGLDEFKINLITKSDFSAYNSKEMHEEVKRNYKKYFDTFICHHFGDEDYAMSSIGGHTHKPKLTTKTNEVMGPIWSLTAGCMCKVDVEYHQQKVMNQNSFALIHVDTWNRQAIPEHVMFTSTMAVVGGKYYFRPDEASELLKAA
jgi:predicted phosphodiesterase